MKILYSAAGTPIPGTHGGSVHTLEICRGLARRGHEVHLVSLGPAAVDAEPATPETPPAAPETPAAAPETPAAAPETPPAERTLAPDGLDGVVLHRLRRTPPSKLLEWTNTWALSETIADVRPDVVIERFYTFGGAGIWAAHKAGVPAVLEINSPARDYPGSVRDKLDTLTGVRLVDRWRRRQLELSAAIYTTSRHLVPPALADDVTVVVNGVDVERFRPGPTTAGDSPLRLVYVSSFRPWHGAEDLVAAAARCRTAGTRFRLTCVGEGPCWQAAKEAAREADLDTTVEFVGNVSHARVAELLAASDVGVAPFSPDRFRALELGWFWSPIKIFEYLAAGLAVVTADIDELRELLPGDVGRFYPAGDVAALADTFTSLAADRDAVRRMGEAARDLACTRYTWDHQAAAVEAVLERVVQ